MASSSKSEPLAADHKEEAAKTSETKQFPSQTRYIAFLVLAIIAVMSAAMGTIWAVVGPKRPHVVVENGYITDSKMSNTTLSGILHFDIGFQSPNNKATIYFDSLKAYASFSDNTKTVLSLDHGFNLTLQL
ncbi:hypothetical protein FEM48_Zijuj02G0037800 [Ziziphus jujuba var. spinosa]|uniref:Late embryogenesis abundant protein LEA-2 subgroup domain-containing protein n=1 Tax=Ziziphus jujuba var. spinosa TaxID=714518 RepID=A0A978VTF9_ZIZJJ|nr:hypothetical protein FEM48_Zijuj02G0037800 [Ziziphus jujuba var. spinosa]